MKIMNLWKKRRTRDIEREGEQPFVDLLKNTSFGEVCVRDTMYMGESVRILTVDETQESATFREEYRRYELVFQYTKRIAELFELVNGTGRTPGEGKVLLIGGAGFSLPKYYISRYPAGRMDVVELHEEMVDIAKEFFFLDQLKRDHDRGRTERLRIFIENGMEFLKKRDTLYDMIINDAYIGCVLDNKLLSAGGLRFIHDALTEGGLYCLNIITSVTGFMSIQGIMEKELAGGYFKNVALIQCDQERDPEHRQNCLLLCSDGELPQI